MLKTEFKRILGTVSMRRFILGLIVFHCLYSLIIWNADSITALLADDSIAFTWEQEEKDYLYRFHENVQKLYEDNQIKSSSLLFDNHAAQQILKKEQKVLQCLVSYHPIEVSSLRIRMVENSMPVYWLLDVVFITLYIFEFIFLDDSDHLYSLFNSMCTSRFRRACAKTFCGLLTLFAVHLMKTINDILIIRIPVNLPIQNINGHMYTSVSWNTAQFISILNLRLFACAGFCLYFLMILVLITRSFSTSCMIIVPFSAIEFILFRLISINSPLSILKNINLFSMISVSESLKGWHINAGSAVPEIVFSSTAGIIILCICIPVSIYFYCWHTQQPVLTHTPKRVLKRRSMTRFHLHSIMITHHGLLMILSVFIYCLVTTLNYRPSVISADHVYEQIRSAYYGPINDKLIKRIQEDTEHSLQALKKLKTYSDPYESMTEKDREEYSEVWAQASRYSYLIQIESDITALKEEGIYEYKNYDGIAYLAYKDNPVSLIQDTLLVIVPIIIMVIVNCSALSHQEIRKVYTPTQTGIKKIIRNYEILINLAGFMLALIVQGFRYLKISSAYPISFHTSVKAVLLIPVNINMEQFCTACFCAGLLVNAVLIHFTKLLVTKRTFPAQ